MPLSGESATFVMEKSDRAKYLFHQFRVHAPMVGFNPHMVRKRDCFGSSGKSSLVCFRQVLLLPCERGAMIVKEKPDKAGAVSWAATFLLLAGTHSCETGGAGAGRPG